MSVITPTEIKKLCERYGLNPSKKYGQNYLISDNPIRKMVEAADIRPGDRVYEIGPGFGVLTFELLKSGARVCAFEIEQKLRPYWEEQQVKYPNLEIVWGNALRLWGSYVANEKGSYKVVANLPYQITSEVLETILESDTPPETVVCMVQKEVAERIIAKPGDMSILAVSIQYFGTPRIVARVGKGSFFPSPKVDSAAVGIGNITSRKDSKIFFKLVKAGFHHKRKMLANNLRDALHLEKEVIEHHLESLNLPSGVRAEALSVDDWIKLSKLLTR